ncbi:hypothetical protein [Thiocapsa sp.]|nr:hypothetical protein [Thiocapsa sp.]
MEAQRTIDDLLAWRGDEHVELIDGEIVQRRTRGPGADRLCPG